MLFRSEIELSDYYGNKLEAEIFKLGHHGSRTSSTPQLLDQVQPKAVIVSAGEKNRYRHPSPSVLDRIKNRDISIYRTDQQGAITIKTNGKNIRVSSFLP